VKLSLSRVSICQSQFLRFVSCQQRALMQSLFARTTADIWGTRDSWSLVPRKELSQKTEDCAVLLEIQGNEKDGYHLVMSPRGFFTADSWHETRQDATTPARELFGVTPADWTIEKTVE
jgi:hypothetical protein